MPNSVYADMLRYVGFDATDAANIMALRPCVEPHVGEIVERFYAVIADDPKAMAVFTGGDEQVSRQRPVLTRWLHDLLGGAYDDDYFNSRTRVGQVHVDAGLPQHYMFTAMEVVRQGFVDIVRRENVDDAVAKLSSLHKLLSVELSVMVESYKESYTRKVKEREREAVEEKLTRAEHLAELGQLAVSLAHEIKNPLAGISGAIQIIRDGLAEDHGHRSIMTEVLGQIRRLDAVVKDLMVYARPPAPKFHSCDLNGVVQRVQTVLSSEPTFGQVRFRFDGHGHLDAIEADEAKIEQLVMNLLLNASQACSDGGDVHLSLAINGAWASIVVEDTGPGIDEEVQQRAFEPFFTTKAKGTGLGLPICKSIVDAHHGHILIKSTIGQGTCVVVKLPQRQPHHQGSD